MHSNSKNRKIKNDIILIAAVLLIAAIGLCVYLLLRHGGKNAVVTVDGELYASYPLDKSLRVEINHNEKVTNVLVIQDGEAYIESADCPDLICVHHSPISHTGESIVCLPNKTVVSIE